jgi:hypothetical protein
MKYAKMILILATMLFAAQPAQALSWNSFSWDNLKKNALAATAIVGLGCTAAYWGFKKVQATPFFPVPFHVPNLPCKNTIFQLSRSSLLERKLADRLIAKGLNAPLSKSQSTTRGTSNTNESNLPDAKLFQNLADTFDTDIKVKYMDAIDCKVIYRGNSSNDNRKMTIKRYSYACSLSLRYEITKNNTGENNKSIWNAIKQMELK